jgi:protein AbiQ
MNLKFFTVNNVYCEFLRKVDPCVPYIYDDKNTRPFVGIVLTVSGFDYFAPLTSPKPKHRSMKNQTDFLKINGGIWGAINFNNMIPIHPICLAEVDMNILATDDKAESDYKNLLVNQLSWCNANKDRIITQAEKLYHVIVAGKARPELAKRCCNFPLDEEQYRKYCELHGLDVLS